MTAPDAEQALGDALAVLAGAGIVACSSSDAAWLEVSASGRSLSLVLEAGSPIPSGELQGAIVQLLQVGLARAAEQAQLRQAAERLEMLSACSFEGILVHVEGEVVYANQRALDMLRCEHADLVRPGVDLWFVVPEDVPVVMHQIQTRADATYVVTVRRKDGTRFRAELQSKQGRFGVRPVRVVAVRDITERERTVALLEESEARLRELAKRAFDYIVYSRNGHVVDVSDGVERVLGYRPDEMRGRSVMDFVAPPSLPQAERALDLQELGIVDILALGKTGEYVPTSSVTLLSTLHGERVRMSAVRDMREVQRVENERRKLSEQQQRTQRLESLGVLAGGIAHDFNNLLTGVLGNAGLLLEGLDAVEDRELCEGIIAAAQRAADLTSQLMACAGRRQLGQPRPVDLANLWRDLAAQLRGRVCERAQLEVRIAPDSLVVGERATLSQVLMNLVLNASEALPSDGGAIAVTAERVTQPDARWNNALGARVGPGEWVLIEVHDTGVGMDAATLERVFEPFFSTKPRGQGLGLASCLGIVSAHGGALLIDSAPGAGTRVSVLLPAALRPGTETPRPRGAQSPGTILVIDDEALVRSFLRRSLERRGFAVVEASDGEAGLRALHDTKPDLVLLDLGMPNLDGAEVLRRVRADGLDVPIVVASGHVDSGTERRLIPGSFQFFLRKPFSSAELLSAVESTLPRDVPP